MLLLWRKGEYQERKKLICISLQNKKEQALDTEEVKGFPRGILEESGGFQKSQPTGIGIQCKDQMIPCSLVLQFQGYPNYPKDNDFKAINVDLGTNLLVLDIQVRVKCMFA